MLKDFFVRFKQAAIISVIVLVVVVVVVWYLLRPRGNFRLAVESSLTSHEQAIKEHFEVAWARTRNIGKYVGELSLTVRGEGSNQITPSRTLEGHLDFGKTVDLTTSFNVEYSVFRFTGKFEVARILEKLYELFGFRDYYLVVPAYQDLVSQQSASPPVKSQPKTWRIVARVHPIDPQNKELSGDVEEIRNQLSVYIFDIFFSLNHDCKTSVCLSGFTRDIGSMEKTFKGFDILFKGKDHFDCLRLDSIGCLVKALEQFQEALSLDRGNAVAHFGVGLIQLSRAYRSVGEDSVYTIGRYFADGVAELASARVNSNFVRRLVDSEPWREVLRSLGPTDLNVTPALLDTAHH